MATPAVLHINAAIGQVQEPLQIDHSTRMAAASQPLPQPSDKACTYRTHGYTPDAVIIIARCLITTGLKTLHPLYSSKSEPRQREG
jgi:hypothetical protein